MRPKRSDSLTALFALPHPEFRQFSHGLHDLRRTTATMLTAQLGLSLELVATVIGHEAGGAQTRTLTRHYVHDDFVDRKADALARWDRRLRQILAGETGKGSRPAGLTPVHQAVLFFSAARRATLISSGCQKKKFAVRERKDVLFVLAPPAPPAPPVVEQSAATGSVNCSTTTLSP
jgi:hypothetical protein